MSDELMKRQDYAIQIVCYARSFFGTVQYCQVQDVAEDEEVDQEDEVFRMKKSVLLNVGPGRTWIRIRSGTSGSQRKIGDDLIHIASSSERKLITLEKNAEGRWSKEGEPRGSNTDDRRQKDGAVDTV